MCQVAGTPSVARVIQLALAAQLLPLQGKQAQLLHVQGKQGICFQQ